MHRTTSTPTTSRPDSRPDSRLLRAALLTLASAAALASAPAQAAPPPGGVFMPIVNAAQMKRLCAQTLAKASAQVKQLERLTSGKGFLAGWNRLDETLQNMDGPASLAANVFPDKATREAADACSTELTSFSAKVNQNERLYKNLMAAQPADAIDAQFKKISAEGFEDTGVALDATQRARMTVILDKLENLRQTFDRNIREDGTTVTMTPAEVSNMPAAWVKARKTDASGNILVDLSSPAYVPFLQSSNNAAARERLWKAKQNEGGTKNLGLMSEITALRREMAALFGLPSYAEYVTRRRMVGNAATVDAFLADVKTRVEAIERTELTELTAAKAKDLGKPLAEVKFERWDNAYYSERVRQERYAIDQEAMRKYFPTQASLAFTFKVAGDLYGIAFEQAKAPTWHADVRYYNVRDTLTKAILGGIYIDMFPRADKYNHAAVWPVRGHSSLLGRKPYSALVTNFNREGLTHDELETLLHEFGHALHGVLSTARHIGLAGTSVKRDFVEAPSQMFEEWARRPETLALFKAVCAVCPQLGADDIKRLDQARKFGQGSRYARQHLYAAWDMGMHGKDAQDPMKLWASMEGNTPMGHVAGTQFPAGFSHVAGGYAAGYYGYMWSEVLALDMLSAFGGQLMNPKVGAKYRSTILASGGEREPMVLVKELLGREPNREAFNAEISGKR